MEKSSQNSTTQPPKQSTEELEATLESLQEMVSQDEKNLELEHLQRLVLTFKKKYSEALHSLANKEGAQGSDEKFKELLIKAQEENKALVHQINTLKTLLKDKTEEENALREKFERVEETLKRLAEQNQQYKRYYTPGVSEGRQAETEEVKVLKEKIGLLEVREKQWKEELWLAKERLMQKKDSSTIPDLPSRQQERDALLEKRTAELREVKSSVHRLMMEKSNLQTKNQQMQKYLQELKIQLNNQNDRFATLQQEREQLAKQVVSKEKLEREYADHEENIASLSKQVQTIQVALEEQRKKSLEEQEELLEAKHHLAKKVKESAGLRERLERSEESFRKGQEELHQAKMRQSELQGLLDAAKGQEKRLEEKVSIAEKQYNEVYERFLKLEASNQELKKIEEKHQRLQGLLTSLGSVMGAPIGITQPHDVVPRTPTPVPPAATVEPFKEKEVEETSFFDFPPEQKPFKTDIFDDE